MKIRNDFVTNSSSSSFITIYANSKTLGKILEEYLELVEQVESEMRTLSMSEYGYSIDRAEDYSFYNPVESYGDILDVLINILSRKLRSKGDELISKIEIFEDIIIKEMELGGSSSEFEYGSFGESGFEAYIESFSDGKVDREDNW